MENKTQLKTEGLSNRQDNNNLVIFSLTFPQQLPVNGKRCPSHGTAVNNKNRSQLVT